LFVVLLIVDPTSQELGPPAIPGRFTTLGLADLTHIVVIEPGDSEADIEDAIGFSPLVSRIDGIRHQSDWDWIEKHEGYLELVYTVSNDGFAFLVLVQDVPGVLPELLALCRGGWSPDA
jgi:hypothetical protein